MQGILCLCLSANLNLTCLYAKHLVDRQAAFGVYVAAQGYAAVPWGLSASLSQGCWPRSALHTVSPGIWQVSVALPPLKAVAWLCCKARLSTYILQVCWADVRQRPATHAAVQRHEWSCTACPHRLRHHALQDPEGPSSAMPRQVILCCAPLTVLSFPRRYLEGAIGERPEDGFSFKFEGSAGMAVNGNTYVFKPPVFTW